MAPAAISMARPVQCRVPHARLSMLSKRAVRPQPLERTVAAAGVPGEEQNLTPSIGFFIGAGFAEWLSQRTGKPLDQLRISVSGAALSRPFCRPRMHKVFTFPIAIVHQQIMQMPDRGIERDAGCLRTDDAEGLHGCISCCMIPSLGVPGGDSHEMPSAHLCAADRPRLAAIGATAGLFNGCWDSQQRHQGGTVRAGHHACHVHELHH